MTPPRDARRNGRTEPSALTPPSVALPFPLRSLDSTYVIAYRILQLPTTRAGAGAGDMTTLKASAARSKLYRLIDETASSHEPIMIAGKRSSAVLVSEDDWRAIQETIYLLSIPRMRQSIRKGLATPIGKCANELPW